MINVPSGEYHYFPGILSSHANFTVRQYESIQPLLQPYRRTVQDRLPILSIILPELTPLPLVARMEKRRDAKWKEPVEWTGRIQIPI